MQNDLISRSALIARFKQLQGADTLANMFVSDVIKEVKNQPTAYNVESVVADAEERRQDLGCNKCRHFKGIHGEECNEDCCDALIDDVLDIVRNGGKE